MAKQVLKCVYSPKGKYTFSHCAFSFREKAQWEMIHSFLFVSLGTKRDRFGHHYFNNSAAYWSHFLPTLLITKLFDRISFLRASPCAKEVPLFAQKLPSSLSSPLLYLTLFLAVHPFNSSSISAFSGLVSFTVQFSSGSPAIMNSLCQSTKKSLLPFLCRCSTFFFQWVSVVIEHCKSTMTKLWLWNSVMLKWQEMIYYAINARKWDVFVYGNLTAFGGRSDIYWYRKWVLIRKKEKDKSSLSALVQGGQLW